jgi:hypothetical protein
LLFLIAAFVSRAFRFKNLIRREEPFNNGTSLVTLGVSCCCVMTLSSLWQILARTILRGKNKQARYDSSIIKQGLLTSGDILDREMERKFSSDALFEFTVYGGI